MSLPVDILITEHKLILQAVEFIKKEVDKIQANKNVNTSFIIATVDFFRTYADRFYHGKEEGILFKELMQKKLKDADRAVMNELIMEHAFARRTVTALKDANENYVSGKTGSLQDILKLIEALVKLYPEHIKKEDSRFFHPSMQYFSSSEQIIMLENFRCFNETFTDRRYQQIVNELQ